VAVDEARVVQVFAPVGREGKGRKGAGFLVCDGLVLTTRHVIEAATGPCQIRRFGSEPWLPTAVAWLGGDEHDAALLRIEQSDPHAEVVEPVRFGRVVSGERAGCEAIGFPWAQLERTESGPVRRTERIEGRVDPRSGLEPVRGRGLLAVHVEGSVPTPRSDGGSPWEGMSGAALFCGGLLVGVVVVDPARFGPDRLVAVPVSDLAAEPRFRTALLGEPDRPLVLGTVEAVDTLRDPYRPLPPSRAGHALSVSVLLRPEVGIVPFRQRARELQRLGEWCSAGAGLAVGLVLGQGGTGKTRLAAELCRAQQAAGAVAGFLEAAAEADPVAALAGREPLLVVVDDAHARSDQVAGLLISLARVDASKPVRVLLLARRLGDWWDVRLPELLYDEIDATVALKGALALELGSVDASAHGRREAFMAAAHAFGAALGRSAENLAEPALGGEQFDAILFIHLAALGAVEGETQLLEGQLVPRDLVQFALEREGRYWADTAAAHGVWLDRIARRRAVAVATLTVAASEDEAADALAAIPDLADAPQQLRPTARWLRDLYLPPLAQPVSNTPETATWFRPLTPDVLGEALLAAVLPEIPGMPSRVLAQATSQQTHAALTELTQAARTHPAVVPPLRQALADNVSALWRTALTVAQEAGDPLGRLMAEVLERRPQPELAEAIEGVLPQRTVALRELAVVATKQALESAPRRRPKHDREARIAQLKNKLSARSAELGRREEALAASKEAVRTYRRLVRARPTAFLPDLALALNYQSSSLAALGRRERALAASEEAVGIYRRLAEAHPDAFLPNLAMALNNHSTRLGALGRREEALIAIDEAVDIYRRLAEAARPDALLPNNALLPDDALLPALADSINNQAASLAALGRREQALAAIEEAADIYRQLAEARPDAFLPNLATSLNNQSSGQAELGRPELALAAIEEAVDIYRRLAEARPDAFLPNLAMALNNQSGRLLALGRPEQALAAIEEAADIYRRLAEARPDTFLPNLANSLNDLSNGLGALGRREQALATIEEAVGIYRPLAEARPDAFLPHLALSLDNRSIRLGALGRRDQALAASEEAVGIYRRLAEARSDTFLPDLANSLTNLSNSLGALGRREQALAAIEEAVDVFRRLAEAHPDAFLPDLAMALNNQSGRLLELGRGEYALAASEEAVQLVLPILERAPYRLPDSGLRLAQNYLDRCHNLQRTPDDETVERLQAVLRNSGVLQSD
jgi:hypothetical protein